MSSSLHFKIVSCALDSSKTAEFTPYVTHARPVFAASRRRPDGQLAEDFESRSMRVSA